MRVFLQVAPLCQALSRCIFEYTVGGAKGSRWKHWVGGRADQKYIIYPMWRVPKGEHGWESGVVIIFALQSCEIHVEPFDNYMIFVTCWEQFQVVLVQKTWWFVLTPVWFENRLRCFWCGKCWEKLSTVFVRGKPEVFGHWSVFLRRLRDLFCERMVILEIFLDKPPIHLENNWSLKDFWRHGEIPKTIALNQQQNMCCLPAHEQETIMGHNVGQNQHKECVACTCKNRSYLNNDVFGRKTKNRHCQREIANQTAPRCGCLSTIWLPCRLSACGRELIALCPQPGTFSNVCFWRLRLPKSCSLHTGIATWLWSETTEHFSFHSHYVFFVGWNLLDLCGHYNMNKLFLSTLRWLAAETICSAVANRWVARGDLG